MKTFLASFMLAVAGTALVSIPVGAACGPVMGLVGLVLGSLETLLAFPLVALLLTVALAALLVKVWRRGAVPVSAVVMVLSVVAVIIDYQKTSAYAGSSPHCSF